MSLRLRPLSDAIGVEVVGVDLRAPISEPDRAALTAAFDRHSLVLVRDQQLSVDEHRRFAEVFGPISARGYAASSDQLDKYISNTRPDGVARSGKLLKHQDFCFYDELLPALSLYAEAVPSSGGETVFAHTQQAYRRLSDAQRRRIQGLHARHVYDYRKDEGDVRFRVADAPEAPTAIHPVALRHPRTGEVGLFVNELMTDGIVDLPATESEALLRELWAVLDQPSVGYVHAWKPHDVIVWDNIALQHGRRDFSPSEARSLRRFQIG